MNQYVVRERFHSRRYLAWRKGRVRGWTDCQRKAARFSHVSAAQWARDLGASVVRLVSTSARSGSDGT